MSCAQAKLALDPNTLQLSFNGAILVEFATVESVHLTSGAKVDVIVPTPVVAAAFGGAVGAAPADDVVIPAVIPAVAPEADDESKVADRHDAAAKNDDDIAMNDGQTAAAAAAPGPRPDGSFQLLFRLLSQGLKSLFVHPRETFGDIKQRLAVRVL